MLKKFFFIAVLLFMGTHLAMATPEEEKAKAFMTDIGEKVITLLTDESIPQQDKAAQFQDILETKFNIKSIGKFVLGRYWKQASAQEKQEFLALFKAATVAIYAARFKGHTSEKFEVIGSRREKDGGVTVLTRIVRPNGQIILVDWKIFEKKGKMQIYDVILEGISMSITQRSEYASVIQNGGGKIQSLITALGQKLQAPMPVQN